MREIKIPLQTRLLDNVTEYGVQEDTDKQDKPTGLFRFCAATTFYDRDRKMVWSHPTGYCNQQLFSCNGHHTPKQAAYHFKQYVLDKCIDYNVGVFGEHTACMFCGTDTHNHVSVRLLNKLYPICPGCACRDNLDVLLGEIKYFVSL